MKSKPLLLIAAIILMLQFDLGFAHGENEKILSFSINTSYSVAIKDTSIPTTISLINTSKRPVYIMISNNLLSSPFYGGIQFTLPNNDLVINKRKEYMMSVPFHSIHLQSGEARILYVDLFRWFEFKQEGYYELPYSTGFDYLWDGEKLTKENRKEVEFSGILRFHVSKGAELTSTSIATSNSKTVGGRTSKP